MNTVVHLFDGSATWEHRVAVAQLLGQQPERHRRHRLLTLGESARTTLGTKDHDVQALPKWLGSRMLAAQSLARACATVGAEVTYCWGMEAAGIARTTSDCPMAVYCSDPSVALRSAKRLRAMSRPTGFAVVCTTETVRRRLIEQGLDPSVIAVIRPAVDFAALNRAQKRGLRERLGIRSTDRAVLVCEPVTRASGAFDAVWACTLRNHLSGGWRVILPGDSPERDRIARFIRSQPTVDPLVLPDPSIGFEELVAVADVLLVTPRGDVSTTAVAWAMAAGVPAVGSAVYSVAELISHKVNGLLFKQIPGRNITAAVLRCLDDETSLAKVCETARGQAYEVFSLRRFVEQHARLCENLRTGQPPATGIADPALSA